MPQEENQETPEKDEGFEKKIWKAFTFDRFMWVVYLLACASIFAIDVYAVYRLIYYRALISDLPIFFFLAIVTYILFLILKRKRPELATRISTNFYFRLFMLFSGLLFVARYHLLTDIVSDFDPRFWLLAALSVFIVVLFLVWVKPKWLTAFFASKHFYLISMGIWLLAFIIVPGERNLFLYDGGYLSFLSGYWIYLLGFALVLASVYGVWKIPLWLNSGLHENDGGELSKFELKEKELKLIDDSRKTVATIIGGLFVVVGAIFTYSNYQLAFEGQVTDRFAKSVALLKEPDISVRTGGLYALERIANDSKKDHPTIMEILAAYIREKSREGYAAFVREKAERLKKPYEEVENSEEAKNEFAQRPSPTDIITAIEIIGRRKEENDKEGFRFNLKGANAQNAKLPGARLLESDLSKANLSGSILDEARLYHADFREATLYKAKLWAANLIGAEMQGAYLEEADLGVADLRDANLERADLGNAILRDANLEGAKNLTFKQLSYAIIDETTKLPDYLMDRRDELLKISEEKRMKSAGDVSE